MATEQQQQQPGERQYWSAITGRTSDGRMAVCSVFNQHQIRSNAVHNNSNPAYLQAAGNPNQT